MSQKLTVRFSSQAKFCQDQLDKFATAFAADPAHALSWSNDTFAVAAKLRVLKQLLVLMEDGSASVDGIRTSLTDSVLQRSRYPAQSTSPTSNLIEQYELAAYAAILQDLKYVE